LNLDKLFVAADEVIARGRADVEQPSPIPLLALARWLAMALGSSRSLAAPREWVWPQAVKAWNSMHVGCWH
jgi:hypothetical protein